MKQDENTINTKRYLAAIKRFAAIKHTNLQYSFWDEVEMMQIIFSLLDRDWTPSELPILKACNQFLISKENTSEDKEKLILAMEQHMEIILKLSQHREYIASLNIILTNLDENYEENNQ